MKARFDFEQIGEWLPAGSRVLDLGCGDGELLAYLREAKQVQGYGIENDPQAIVACIQAGVDVLQMNLEDGLSAFGDGSFDCVILSLTLQTIKHTEEIMREMLRVGREVIVTFPNFGYWQHRLALLGGEMPVSKTLPFAWYNTPNVRQFTVLEFEKFCRVVGASVKGCAVMHEGQLITWLPNLMGSVAIYRLGRQL